MVWDRNEPVASSALTSDPMRQNFQAMDYSLFGNLVQDPYFLIWPLVDQPAHWNKSGDGAIVRETGDFRGISSAKMTLVTNTTTLSQVLMVNIPDFIKGETIAFGGYVKTATSGLASIILDDGVTVTKLTHNGDGEWQWLSGVKTLSNSTTNLNLLTEIDIAAGSGFALFDLMIAQIGQVAPQLFIPPQIDEETFYVHLDGAVGVGNKQAIFTAPRPLIVVNATLDIETAPTGSDLIADITQFDGISTYTSMYTVKPTIIDGAVTGGADPDGAHNLRCFFGTQNVFSRNQARIGVDVTQVGSTTPGDDLRLYIRTRQFQDPLLMFK